MPQARSAISARTASMDQSIGSTSPNGASAASPGSEAIGIGCLEKVRAAPRLLHRSYPEFSSSPRYLILRRQVSTNRLPLYSFGQRPVFRFQSRHAGKLALICRDQDRASATGLRRN
jgi:hypothetical protein